eukprot:10491444-Heterocapsa_arctica.AAC.1
MDWHDAPLTKTRRAPAFTKHFMSWLEARVLYLSAQPVHRLVSIKGVRTEALETKTFARHWACSALGVTHEGAVGPKQPIGCSF